MNSEKELLNFIKKEMPFIVIESTGCDFAPHTPHMMLVFGWIYHKEANKERDFVVFVINRTNWDFIYFKTTSNIHAPLIFGAMKKFTAMKTIGEI